MPFFVLISRAINFNSKWPKIVRNPAPCQTEITKAKVEKKKTRLWLISYTHLLLLPVPVKFFYYILFYYYGVSGKCLPATTNFPRLMICEEMYVCKYLHK